MCLKDIVQNEANLRDGLPTVSPESGPVFSDSLEEHTHNQVLSDLQQT